MRRFAHRSVVVFLLLALVVSCAQAYDNTNRHRTLPTNNASYMLNLQDFLQLEDADRYKEMFAPFILENTGTHPTAASLTSTPFATQGYTTDGLYVTQVAASITYPDNKTYCWVFLDYGKTGNHLTFKRVMGSTTGTHYLIDCTSGTTQPPLPLTSAWLMRVTTAGGAITGVLRLVNPNPVLSTRVGVGKNVRECGAKVDGTTDDGPALNDCLIRFAHVVIPEGVLLSSIPTVVNPGNTLSGMGYGGTANSAATRPGSILHYTGAGDAIAAVYTTLTNCVCVLHDFSVQSASGTVGIHLKNIADFHIDRMAISGRLGPPAAATGFTIAGIWLDGGGGSGDQAMITTKITNSYIAPVAGHGILGAGVNNTNAIVIAGNRIQGNGGIGILTQSRARGWKVVGNDIEGNAGGGIKVQEKGEAWEITGNYLEANGSLWQIWLRMCSACHVAGNSMQGMGAGIPDSAGILLGDTPGGGYVPQAVTILSNQFQDVAMAVSIDACWGVTIAFNSRQITTVLEVGGTFLNVQSLDHLAGSVLSDAVPGAAAIETRPVIQGLKTTNTGPGNSPAETTLYTETILAHTLGHAGRYTGEFSFEGSGAVFQNSGTNRDVTVRVKLGAITICQLLWTALPSGAVRGFTLKATVAASTSFGLGRLLGACEGDMGPLASADGTVVSAPSVRLVAVYPSSSGATVNVAVNLTFLVTGQLGGAADANFNMAMERGHVTRLQY